MPKPAKKKGAAKKTAAAKILPMVLSPEEELAVSVKAASKKKVAAPKKAAPPPVKPPVSWEQIEKDIAEMKESSRQKERSTKNKKVKADPPVILPTKAIEHQGGIVVVMPEEPIPADTETGVPSIVEVRDGIVSIKTEPS